jgi:hypothetical protein
MDWFPDPYEDETLYSVLARLSVYLGVPHSATFSRAITGARHWVALTQLPCQLNSLADRFGRDREFIDRLIDRHSLLPFYTAYVAADVRRASREAMHGSAYALHFALNMSNCPVPAPTHLRFCPACLDEMQQRYDEAWWRRIHQLPGIEICALHGEPLRNSAVELGRVGRHVLVAADDQSCPMASNSSGHIDLANSVREKLIVLAQAAQRLLDDPPPALEPVDLHKRRMVALVAAGLTRGTSKIRWDALESRVGEFWEGALQAFPRLRLAAPDSRSWLLKHVRNKWRLAHPLRHLVVDLAIGNGPAYRAGLQHSLGGRPR